MEILYKLVKVVCVVCGFRKTVRIRMGEGVTVENALSWFECPDCKNYSFEPEES